MEKKVLKFACKRSEYHASRGDIMLPTDIRDLQEPEYMYDEYGKYQLYYDGTRKLIKNEIQVSNRITFLDTGCEDKFSFWNGCIYSDIDSKKFYAEDPEKYDQEYAKKVYYKIITFLYQNYTDNFYYGEVSSSKTSYHFIFYFDCERTEDNFNFYNKLVKHIITEAFEKCGYSDIIHHSGVLDNCISSIHQRLFITKYEYVFNNNCTGNLVKTIFDEKIKHDILQEKMEAAIKKIRALEKQAEFEKKRSEGLDYEVHIEKTGIYKNIYIEHAVRYKLFVSLYYFYKDNIKDVWNETVLHIPESNGHTINYYRNCPFRNDWYKCLEDGSKPVFYDKQLLTDFGFKVYYTSKQTL